MPLQQALALTDLDNLVEVVLDLGRPPEARFRGGRYQAVLPDAVTYLELEMVTRSLSAFTSDNRAGIPRTLHRISAIRNRQGTVVGLTCRVGKAITGTIASIEDLIRTQKSILFLGPPGVGKTTRLREVAKLLADDAHKRVIIVDTSNEIAGDGDIPHPAVGHARRMQVSSPDQQQHVMIEAVENHTPEVVVVDEIGTTEEAQAARTIAERGVILIATAHGGSLENLIKNPILSDLIGGIQAVTLGDEEAKRRASQKTVLEREKKPTFDICIEIRDHGTLAVYPDVAEAVDHLLRGWTLFPEVRKTADDGHVRVLQSDVRALPELHAPAAVMQTELALGTPVNGIPFQRNEANAEAEVDEHQAIRLNLQHLSGQLQQHGTTTTPGVFKLFLYAVSRHFVEKIIERLQLRSLMITNQLYDANAIIALRGSARPGSKIAQLAQTYDIPIIVAKANTTPHIQRAIREALQEQQGSLSNLLLETTPENETDMALKEVETAIDQFLQGGQPVELAPRRSFIRRLQHEVVEKHQLHSISIGDEPNRRLKIVNKA